LTLPNPFPEAASRHPHSRRLPKHARHLIGQMLKGRLAVRGSVLQTQTRQLDSAVNLREHPDRLHPDHDRHAPGVRVVLGSQTRSLLRQLRESRDIRVQQQLVREIIHQVQKQVLAVLRRAARMEKALERGARAVRSTRKQGKRLAAWLRVLPRRTRDKWNSRHIRVVGGRPRTTAARPRKPAASRTRVGISVWTRTPARTRKPAAPPARTPAAPPARTPAAPAAPAAPVAPPARTRKPTAGTRSKPAARQ
jgi:hypothetical protein